MFRVMRKYTIASDERHVKNFSGDTGECFVPLKCCTMCLAERSQPINDNTFSYFTVEPKKKIYQTYHQPHFEWKKGIQCAFLFFPRAQFLISGNMDCFKNPLKDFSQWGNHAHVHNVLYTIQVSTATGVCL